MNSMGKLLPGIFVSFANPKGGVGKSTLTALFAGYLHTIGKESGLKVGVVDIDDAQNTLGKMRNFETENDNIEDEYEIMNISSSDFINQAEFLKDSFDIILVDFPGNLKQPGVVESLILMDVIVMPFTPNQIELTHTIDFYNYYVNNILSKRESFGYKTVIRGVLNRVSTNLLEYKELISSKDNLPFVLLENHIKDSKVNYQRNLTTLMKDYQSTCDEFGEEMIELITEQNNKN